MKRTILALVVLLLVVFCAHVSSAQTTAPASWPECRLGKAPVAPGPAPAGATVSPAPGGPVIMSEAGLNGAVRLIRCRLAAGTPSYRGADGVLRDVASNQPYWPVGWDATAAPLATAAPTAPNPIATAINAAVTGELAVHVDGDVNIHHSGTVDVAERRATPPPHHSRCGMKCKVGIAVVAAVVSGTTWWATHRGGKKSCGIGPGGNTGPAF